MPYSMKFSDETFYVFASFEVTTALMLEDPDLL